MHAIVELFIRWIHLIAAMIWFSSVFFSAIVVAPILKRNLPSVESLQRVAAIREHLQPIVRITIHVLLVTGAMNFFIVGLNTEMRFSRNYVLIFAVKLGFVGMMALFHGLYISVFGRKLEAAVGELKVDDSPIPASIARLERRIRLFAILTMLSGLATFALALAFR